MSWNIGFKIKNDNKNNKYHAKIFFFFFLNNNIIKIKINVINQLL
jgi:hypothetical protein